MTAALMRYCLGLNYTKLNFLELYKSAFRAEIANIMSTYKEKLSILSEMIAFAKIDKKVGEAEYNFLLGVAAHLDIDRKTFDSLFEKEAEHVILKSETERIIQFHRLLLLMNVDKKRLPIEISRIKNIGLGLGLPPSAIDQVLEKMHHYPDKIIPPNVLIGIFRAHYN